jgi:hypothetical protein
VCLGLSVIGECREWRRNETRIGSRIRTPCVTTPSPSGATRTCRVDCDTKMRAIQWGWEDGEGRREDDRCESLESGFSNCLRFQGTDNQKRSISLQERAVNGGECHPLRCRSIRTLGEPARGTPHLDCIVNHPLASHKSSTERHFSCDVR